MNDTVVYIDYNYYTLEITYYCIFVIGLVASLGWYQSMGRLFALDLLDLLAYGLMWATVYTLHNIKKVGQNL